MGGDHKNITEPYGGDHKNITEHYGISGKFHRTQPKTSDPPPGDKLWPVAERWELDNTFKELIKKMIGGS